MTKFLLAVGIVLTAALGACDHAGDGTAAAAESRPVHVDSILPIEEELRRFRATLSEHPERLAGGAAEREQLVRAFVAAIEAEDVAALHRLVVTRAEFAYLYYPHTRYVARPYELSPAIVWFQMDNHGGRGLSRALRRYGGEPLGYVAHRCDEAPTAEAENRIWTGCVVERRRDDGELETIALLGPILERDGRHKFLSFANGL